MSDYSTKLDYGIITLPFSAYSTWATQSNRIILVKIHPRISSIILWPSLNSLINLFLFFSNSMSFFFKIVIYMSLPDPYLSMALHVYSSRCLGLLILVLWYSIFTIQYFILQLMWIFFLLYGTMFILCIHQWVIDWKSMGNSPT